MSVPQRPSDAIEAALVTQFHDDRWRGDKRLGSVGVKTLVALREMGWDVVRRSRPPASIEEDSNE